MAGMSSEHSPSVLTKATVAATSLLVFVLVTALTDSNVGAAVGFGYAALVVAVIVTWHLRHRAFYWPTFALLTAAHIAVLIKWHPLIPSPAIQVAPLVLIDFVCMVAVLFTLDRFPASRGK
jgi:hypothetical protein